MEVTGWRSHQCESIVAVQRLPYDNHYYDDYIYDKFFDTRISMYCRMGYLK